MGKSGVTGDTNGDLNTALFGLPFYGTTNGKVLFVADYWNNGIRKIDIATKIVSTIVDSSSQFSGMTIDGKNLYAFDMMTSSIKKIDIDTNAITTLAGNGTSGALDGYGLNASFDSFSSGLTTDGKSLFLSDGVNGKIRKINLLTGYVSTLGLATYNIPEGLTTDGDFLYIVEIGTASIHKINISDLSDVTIYTSSSGLGGGITTDGSNLYFIEDNSVMKIDLKSGVTGLVAGAATSGGLDGNGGTARFNLPHDVTTDGKSLFVMDSHNYTIRKIE